MIECLTCGKTFDETDAAISDHTLEHIEIERGLARQGYPFTSDFPIRMRRRTEVLDK